jgi:ABC-type spermidine/putrescine transport system permease subunit I
MGNFLIPQFLSGGRGAISGLIFLAYNTGLNYPVAAARSITLLVVIFAVVFVMARVGDISDIART